MAKKEVKNPRKPATKKASKEKKQEVKDLTNLANEELVEEYKKLDENELFTVTDKQVETINLVMYNPAPIEKIELKPENIITGTDFDNDSNQEDLGDDANQQEQEEQKLDPQAVIEEYTEKAKELDDVVKSGRTAEEIEKTLKESLVNADKVKEQLEKEIKEKEVQFFSRRTNSWNGSSDGWYY